MTTAPVTVAFRRIYMDISGEVDAQLEALSTLKGMSKKKFVEALITAAVAEHEAAEAKAKKGKK